MKRIELYLVFFVVVFVITLGSILMKFDSKINNLEAENQAQQERIELLSDTLTDLYYENLERERDFDNLVDELDLYYTSEEVNELFDHLYNTVLPNYEFYIGDYTRAELKVFIAEMFEAMENVQGADRPFRVEIDYTAETYTLFTLYEGSYVEVGTKTFDDLIEQYFGG